MWSELKNIYSVCKCFILFYIINFNSCKINVLFMVLYMVNSCNNKMFLYTEVTFSLNNALLTLCAILKVCILQKIQFMYIEK